MKQITFTTNQIEYLQEMTDVNMHDEAMQHLLIRIDELSEDSIVSLFCRSLRVRLSSITLDDLQGMAQINARKAIYRDINDLGQKVISNFDQVWQAL